MPVTNAIGKRKADDDPVEGISSVLDDEAIQSASPAKSIHELTHGEDNIGSPSKRKRVSATAPTFAIGKMTTLVSKVQDAMKLGKSSAGGIVKEYERFMTLLARADEERVEHFVAPPLVRDVWELHRQMADDYPADCTAAGLDATALRHEMPSYSSPCGPTGGMILTMYAYLNAFGRWPATRWWLYDDDAVDTILLTLNKNGNILPESAQNDSSGASDAHGRTSTQ